MVTPFDVRHAHSNKLTQLESEDLQAADFVVLSDCDIAFCEDISPWISGDSLRAKVVDIANFSIDHWQRIFSAAQLPLPKSRVASTFDHRETLSSYCNGGLLILPQPVFQQLRVLWPKWNRWLLDKPELLEPFGFFTDQVSLSLSLEEAGLTVDHLGVEFNFPTHLPCASPEGITVSPKVIHYHDRVDPSGFLIPTQISSVDRRIEKVNELIRANRRTNLDNFSFWEARYFLHPDLGSGIGSRGNNLLIKKGILQTQLAILNPTSVLDVGCGDLEVTRDLSIPGYTGIDISSAAVELAGGKRPDWEFFSGDIFELALSPHDLVICLDVTIHQPTRKMYETLCRRLLDLSARNLIVAGYNQPPWHTSEITFYYEPLSDTLRKLSAGEIEIIGGYRDTTILRWSRP